MESFFEYNGVQYGWLNSQFVDHRIDDRADIGVYKLSRPLAPNLHTWATITDDDLIQMPLLKQAINNIGTTQESILVKTNLSNSEELDKYREWTEKNTPSGVFEYNESYFLTYFWIA